MNEREVREVRLEKWGWRERRRSFWSLGWGTCAFLPLPPLPLFSCHRSSILFLFSSLSYKKILWFLSSALFWISNAGRFFFFSDILSPIWWGAFCPAFALFCEKKLWLTTMISLYRLPNRVYIPSRRRQKSIFASSGWAHLEQRIRRPSFVRFALVPPRYIHIQTQNMR